VGFVLIVDICKEISVRGNNLKYLDAYPIAVHKSRGHGEFDAIRSVGYETKLICIEIRLKQIRALCDQFIFGRGLANDAVNDGILEHVRLIYLIVGHKRGVFTLDDVHLCIFQEGNQLIKSGCVFPILLLKGELSFTELLQTMRDNFIAFFLDGAEFNRLHDDAIDAISKEDRNDTKGNAQVKDCTCSHDKKFASQNYEILPCALAIVPVNSTELLKTFSSRFPGTPTNDQRSAMEALSHYLLEDPEERLFILKGYAGTGKTTLMRTLASCLPSFNMRAVLAAPTGRAAKVLQGQLKRRAYTLHRMLYLTVRDPAGGFKRIKRPNKGTNRVYIVDEASMLGDIGESRTLFEDLLHFVTQGEDCRLILVGDEAQLPPVGQDFSPALLPRHIRDHYGWRIRGAALFEVMRQVQGSSILTNATVLRDALRLTPPQFPTLHQGPQVRRLQDAHEVFEALESAYQGGAHDAVVITRSNQRAVAYNRQIRGQLLWREDILNAGDVVMVVQNNERWIDPEDSAGFIANGDMFEVQSWRNQEERYGLTFADATLRWLDRDEEPHVEAKVLLNALDSHAARLPEAQMKGLIAGAREEAQRLPKAQRSEFLREHPYLQALQLKFGYALTGHKSQGGQWPHVFVEWPYTPSPDDVDFIRWMYTAFTRAQESLSLIGFPASTFDTE
jgi:exodeoxyribonuclease V